MFTTVVIAVVDTLRGQMPSGSRLPQGTLGGASTCSLEPALDAVLEFANGTE